MRVGACIFNQNYTDWDRYEAEERGESVPSRPTKSDREIFAEEINLARIADQRHGRGQHRLVVTAHESRDDMPERGIGDGAPTVRVQRRDRVRHDQLVHRLVRPCATDHPVEQGRDAGLHDVR